MRPYQVSPLSQPSAGWVRPEYSKNACCGCCFIEVHLEVFPFRDCFLEKEQLGQVRSGLSQRARVHGNSTVLGVKRQKGDDVLGTDGGLVCQGDMG